MSKKRGFQHQKFEFFKKNSFGILKKQKIQCILCGSDDVKAEFIREREIQVLPIGDMLTCVRFRVHRLFCHNCHKHKATAVQAQVLSEKFEQLSSFILFWCGR